ncbi:MAG: UbiX family flavin prenyltransferase [Nitrospirae bacterium]|nr:UbiX family flavin prenyltransferase [Nitrospirota bacterium]
MNRYILAITGATGPVIGLRVLESLLRDAEVHLMISRPAVSIIEEEVGVDLSRGPEEELIAWLDRRSGSSGGAGALSGRLHLHDEKDLWAPVSSGSFPVDAMFIVPCTMKTLSAIANGYADGLIERAADVAIKEGRPLVLSPRETPLSAVHLENMLKLARLGVRIVPPVAGFYSKPESIDDMVDFMAGKILDQLRIDHGLYRRWRQ